jgi:hypothetical protein
MKEKQDFEMTSSKERHQADREWGGGATPFLKKKLRKKTRDRSNAWV